MTMMPSEFSWRQDISASRVHASLVPLADDRARDATMNSSSAPGRGASPSSRANTRRLPPAGRPTPLRSGGVRNLRWPESRDIRLRSRR